jgi:hypothetical protein
MFQLISNGCWRAAAAVLVVLIAGLALAACGSSSNSSSTSAGAAAATSTPSRGATSTTGGAGPRFGRFAALRECLRKNGVTLPQRAPRQQPGPAGGLFLGGGAGPTLPKGVTRAQYLAALKKCGGGALPGGAARLRGPGFSGRFNGPAFTQRLTKFASCMRENGVNVPSPNTAGNGPIFNTKGLNITSPQFRAAETKCRSYLQGVLRRLGGGVGGAPGASAPGTGGGAAGAPPAGSEAPSGAG